MSFASDLTIVFTSFSSEMDYKVLLIASQLVFRLLHAYSQVDHLVQRDIKVKFPSMKNECIIFQRWVETEKKLYLPDSGNE